MGYNIVMDLYQKPIKYVLIFVTVIWITIIITHTRILIFETRVNPGVYYEVEGYGDLSNASQASLVCKYFTGSTILTDVFWYSPNNIMGKNKCPLILTN
jgi:hypothetical protein